MYAPQTNLGSLSSFFKKAVKVATKLSPSHQIAKAISPKLLALSPSHALAEKISKSASKKKAPKPAAATPDPVPTPTQTSKAPDLTAFNQAQQQPMSFGGGGGGSQPYTDVPASADATETNYAPWLIGGGLALVAAYFIFRKK